jgi:transposase
VQKTKSKLLTKELLEQIYAEVEVRVESKFRVRVEQLEREVEKRKEEARVWKARYFKEQERSRKLEGQLSLALNEIKELKEVVQKQRTRIIELEKIVYGRKTEVTKVQPTEAEQPEKRSRGRQNGAKGYGRKKRTNLETEDRVHQFKGNELLCACCGLPFEEIGEKTSEETDVKISVVIVRHRRKTVRRTCRCPGTPAVKTPSAPPKLFRGSAYSVDFWQHVIYEKYHLQRPTSRTCKFLLSYGLDVGPSVIVNGLKKLHNQRIFKPLVEAIAERVRCSNRQQKDETGWKIFQEIEGKESYQHWLWVSLTDDCCLFQMDPSRSREVAKRTIGDTPVIVTSDMLKVYDDLGDNVTNSWCWAHVRRYLLKLGTRPELSKSSKDWVSKVDWLYHCNNQRLATSNEREFQVFDRELRKSIAEFKRLAKSNSARLNDPEAKKVFTMIANHWDGLELFVEYPAVPMDNNLSEQALRNAVVGRKCYYGSGSCWSGDLSADLFTIFTTLEMNGINARTWLSEYLSAVAKNGGQAPPEYLDFLPWNSPPAHLLSN